MSYVVVQLLSHVHHVQPFANPWTAARQSPLSSIISWSLLKFMCMESVMLSNYLILCYPLLLLPSIFPSLRVFSNESALHIRWPKYWSFNISPSNEYSELIWSRISWDFPGKNIAVGCFTSFSRGSSQSMDQTCVPCVSSIAGGFFTTSECHLGTPHPNPDTYLQKSNAWPRVNYTTPKAAWCEDLTHWKRL